MTGNIPAAKRPTSRDVARLAGVSQTTVSLVMNGVASVAITDETRNRVRNAIAELDYHPHEGARSLSRKATRTIGVAIPDASNPHYLEITAAIEAYAEHEGYSIFLVNTNYDVLRERRCIQWLKQQRMDALIICASTGVDIDEEIRAVREQGYHITTFLENIRAHQGSGERTLIEHLVALGHGRIGYINGVTDERVFGSRIHYCLDAQRELRVPVVDAWVCRCGPTVDEGYRATAALLAGCESGDRPTALVVINDLLAGGTIAALHARAMRVPEQMSVAAFDNTRLARYSIPPLTSVDPEAHAMGEHIARIAIDRLTHPERAPRFGETYSRLVVRASTGPAPAL